MGKYYIIRTFSRSENAWKISLCPLCEKWVTQKLFLFTSNVTFSDHESCIRELVSDLASCMRQEFCNCQHLSILEKKGDSHSVRSSNSDNPFHGVEHCHVEGERGTPYPCLSHHLQMAHHMGGPPCEENCEYWVGDGSGGHPLRLIPIEDTIISPPLSSSSSEDGEYHEAPIESGGIMDVDNEELDLV